MTQKRDDDLKHNPCLKPFDELTDTEKAYDVEMAFQTLRLGIVAATACVYYYVACVQDPTGSWLSDWY